MTSYPEFPSQKNRAIKGEACPYLSPFSPMPLLPKQALSLSENSGLMTYRILLVEDEESLASALQLNLELEGYEVIHAPDGPTALQKFRSQALDLAILDVMIPEVDGFSVCQTIRLEGNTTPVLFLSAKGSGKDRVEGLRIGGDDYLTKPFDLEELMLRVAKLIRRKEEPQKTLADRPEYHFNGGSIHFLHFTITEKETIVREFGTTDSWQTGTWKDQMWKFPI